MSIQIECTGNSPVLMHSDRASDPLSKEAQWLSEISDAEFHESSR